MDTPSRRVVRITTHYWHRCEDPECFVCSGGLGLCKICGGAEGSLTTHCCGHALDGDVHELVQGGSLDYRADLSWHDPTTIKKTR